MLTVKSVFAKGIDVKPAKRGPCVCLERSKLFRPFRILGGYQSYASTRHHVGQNVLCVSESCSNAHQGRPGVGGARKPGIVWFRGDLRLHDNEALTKAQGESTSLLSVYCFDPREYGRSPQGYDKTGPYRAQFLIEAVNDLRNRLRQLGGELLVRLGKPEDVIPEVARKVGAAKVFCHSEATSEDNLVQTSVETALEGTGVELTTVWGGTLHMLDDLPFKLSQLPQTFEKFRNEIEKATIREALPAPTEIKGVPLGMQLDMGGIPSLKDLGLDPLPIDSGAQCRGGEGEALGQLEEFLQLVGKGACASNFASCIAPWLATGCLSPRHMLEKVLRSTEAERQEASMTWVKFELLWRDFFRLMTKKFADHPARPQPALV